MPMPCRAALQRVVDRHPMLRATFQEVDGVPVQLVHDGQQVELCVECAHRWTDAQLEDRLAAASYAEFDLTNGPLARFCLLKRSATDHVLVLALHHLITDMWSMVMLVDELTGFYGFELTGRGEPRPPSRSQFVDFVQDEQNLVDSERGAALLEFWRNELRHAPTTLGLPTDRRRPAITSGRGAATSTVIDADLTAAIGELASSSSTTPFAVVLAVLQTLLHRYTGQDDIVVGTIKANRSLRRARVMGCFLNTVPLRSDLSGNPSFAELLDRVSRTVTAAFHHDAYPFRRVVEELRPPSNGPAAPFLEVVYSWQKSIRAIDPDLASALALSRPAVDAVVNGMAVQSMAIATRPIPSELALLVGEVGDELVATFEYSTDLYDRSTIERMIGHFRTLLAAVVIDPRVPVGQVELLTSAERAELERASSGPVVPVDAGASVHVLVERQVEATPDRVAVSCGADTLTYAGLNARANQLARHLVGLGVGPGDLVGVCLERSVDVVVAVLAVLKAGAGYVPLDPELPPERVGLMLADSNASVLITRTDLSAGAARPADEAGGPARVLLDEHSERIAGHPTANLAIRVAGTDLAYVIYTSGSTGRPKGVQVEHRSVVNFLHTMAARPGITADDVVLSVISLSFDPSVFELFLPLVHGARTVIAERDATVDGAALSLLLQDTGATLMQATPTTWRMLLEHGWSGQPGLTAVCGGERMPPGLADQLLARCQTLWNVYGPTETTVCATAHLVTAGRSSGSVPIGTAVDNVRCYVLDSNLGLVPVGVTGELFIGGPGLARGYLNQPALTAERFVADPYHAPDRMYRTGDLVRRLPDGALEHLGRVDHQVKIRGHRIELGEIEATLTTHPGVRAAVVTTSESTTGDTRLVAYYVPDDTDSEPSADQLRDHLRRSLPTYMIPAVYVPLAAFPLTPNHKIDRNELPPPPTGTSRPSLVRPSTPLQARLVTIWTEVLGEQPIGIHDDFFELGGHSLLATRIASRIRATLGVDVPVRVIFDHPTVATLADHLDAGGTPALSASRPDIIPVGRDRPLPLSMSQERMRFLYDLQPESAAYNMAGAIRLRGALDRGALDAAINDVVARHEGLRTTFPIEGGRQVQRIEPVAEVDVEVLDRRSLPTGDRLEAVIEEMRTATRRPFRLDQLPLARFVLYQVEDDEHLLYVNVHHIIGDQWSFGVLSRDLSACYNARRAGTVPELAPLAIQFADYAQWHRSWIESGAVDDQLEYWRGQLDRCPTIDLPADRPRPAVQTGHGAMLKVPIPADLSRGIEELCLRSRVTPFMVLLAALDVLLHRYTGADDIAVGTAIANRNWLESEGLIGSFVNTLVLRADLSGDPTFAELLERVHEVALDAYANQDVPFAAVVSELRPARDLSRSPLFQVFLNVENAPFGLPELSGLTAEILTIDRGASQFDLSLSVDLSVRHEATIEYSTDLFDRSTVERMVTHLWAALKRLLADPEVTVGQVDILTEEARAVLEETWSGPTVPVDVHLTAHALFEQQAQRTPERVAVHFAGEALSYAALDARANRLAHHLVELGVARGDLVGIQLDRSLDVVVAVLGVMKAGAAYVPLDPGLPPGRLSFMLSDSGASVVITRRGVAPAVAEVAGAPAPMLVLVDDHVDSISRQPTGNPGVPVTGADVAYVIYTSGSTGRPKGVQVEHRSVVNFLQAMATRPGITADDVVLSVINLSFDPSVFDLLLPLMCGAQTVIAEPDTILDATELGHVLADSGVTIMQATPATWRMLLEHGWRGSAHLTAVCGGEAMPPALADALLARCRAVWNVYGPTETTVCATAYQVQGRPASDRVPIGTPIDNTRCYVLDGHLRPLPVGVPGELYIGGDGVGRGYLHQPELTARRFVADPFNPGRRMYRTGDVARLLADGALEHLGRVDQQVKVRGHRIELGEIDATLVAHPAVRAAVTTTYEPTAGDRRLVAYFVPDDVHPPTPDDLRRHLRATLPAYMIPAVYVPMMALPLTPNGKIDRDQLPTPPTAPPPLDEPGARSSLEVQLLEIWSEVLGQPNIGIHDDFFDLGGHSLLATQIVSRVRVRLRAELAVRALFDCPTVARLAEHLSSHEGAPGFSAVLPEITPVRRDLPLPLSVSQERMRFLYELHPDSPAYNMAGSARLRGSLDVGALGAAINDVVARHEGLRTTFPIEGGEQVQRIHPEATVEIEVLDRRSLPPAGRVEAIAEEMRAATRTPFRLEELPLLRLTLYRIDDEDHLLFLNMHHIIGDQWSFGVLSRDLAACYNARRGGNAPTLPPLDIQFADYARWHRGWIEGGAIDAQLDYWRAQLDRGPTIDLPSDRPRPPVLSGNGAMLSVPIPVGIRAGIEALCLRFRVSPFMVLLAALDTLVHRYTGADDIVVGTAIANRNWLESEGLIGTFVNTLVLRTDLSGDPTFAQLLDRVQGVALDAYANQDVPFATVVNELRPQRDLSRSPLFQIFLNVENAPFDVPALDGLTTELVTVERGAAQFDLSLSIDLLVRSQATIEYSTDLFDASTVERLVEHLWTLLEATVADPAVRVDEVGYLTAAERVELEAAWSGPEVPVDSEVGVNALFERQAMATPGHVAVRCGDESLTYSALNARANRLAHHLIGLGVSRGDLVGVRLERSLDMVVAVLGVMKAGGAYVPLDPGFPASRLSLMLADSAAPVVISRADLPWSGAQSGDGDPSPVCVLLDQHHDQIAGHPADDPRVGVTGADLAYVIYTSGSTGRPKGVQVEHQNVVNFLQAMAVEPGIAADDVLVSVTTLSFDISVLELFLPLLHGAQTVIADGQATVDAAALARLLATSGATMMQATPTTWRLLVEHGWPGQRGLVALCGGEQMPPDLADLLVTRCDTLWNMYGPTETTVWSTVHRVERCGRPDRGSIPIGTPIDNTRCYVLDANLQPLPVGAPGELFISGDGVARGYLHQPELTAERFLPDPFVDGGRMYRSGDQARLLPDGTLDHLGRADQQVKIRGHRIELGEIEATLTTHPAVRASVVAMREVTPGDTRLVAYYLHDRQPPDADDLREHLRATLPNYMIPASYVPMADFPLTPNNKIDRQRLPSPSAAPLRPRLAPQNPLQAELAAIWSEVLGIDHIGIHDDFFDLGGHSLLAIRVFAAIERLTGERLPLTVLFQAPTIAAFAELLVTERPDARWTSLVAAQPEGSRRPFFYVSPFLITVLSFSHLARHLGPDQPFYAIQPQGMEGDHPIHQRVEDMAAHYVEELREVQPRGPYLLGGHCAGSWVAFEMARQLQADGDEVELLALVDSEPPSIDPPRINRLRYMVSRLAHYWRDRRLVDSLRWEIGLFWERFVTRRVGPEESRRLAVLRDAHAEAHRRYRGGIVKGDALLIRSQEWAKLPDKDWHLRWRELITGDLRVETVQGSHAALVENANAAELAATFRSAIEQAERSHEGLEASRA